jgi:tetratricopeptide (TPR) repeat protein
VHSVSALELAKQLRSRYQLLFAHALVASALCWLGRWNEAKEHIDAGLAIDPNEERLRATLQLYELGLGTGSGHSPSPSTLHTLADEIAALPDGVAILQKRIASGWGPTFLFEPSWKDFSLPLGSGFAAAVLGDTDAAKRHYAHLKRVALADLESPRWAFRAVGRVALAAGDAESAEHAFKRTIDRCRRHGARPELARTLNDYAGLLEQRDGPGDKERAAKLRDEALQLARDLGMKPLIERILKRRQLLKA